MNDPIASASAPPICGEIIWVTPNASVAALNAGRVAAVPLEVEQADGLAPGLAFVTTGADIDATILGSVAVGQQDPSVAELEEMARVP